MTPQGLQPRSAQKKESTTPSAPRSAEVAIFFFLSFLKLLLYLQSRCPGQAWYGLEEFSSSPLRQWLRWSDLVFSWCEASHHWFPATSECTKSLKTRAALNWHHWFPATSECIKSLKTRAALNWSLLQHDQGIFHLLTPTHLCSSECRSLDLSSERQTDRQKERMSLSIWAQRERERERQRMRTRERERHTHTLYFHQITPPPNPNRSHARYRRTPAYLFGEAKVSFWCGWKTGLSVTFTPETTNDALAKERTFWHWVHHFARRCARKEMKWFITCPHWRAFETFWLQSSCHKLNPGYFVSVYWKNMRYAGFIFFLFSYLDKWVITRWLFWTNTRMKQTHVTTVILTRNDCLLP